MRYEKGKKYIIEALCQCPGCGKWQIDIGLKNSNGYLGTRCTVCFADINEDNKLWASSLNFAPIQDQYNDITEQLASDMKEVVEAPDIKKIVEPQTN